MHVEYLGVATLYQESVGLPVLFRFSTFQNMLRLVAWRDAQ